MQMQLAAVIKVQNEETNNKQLNRMYDFITKLDSVLIQNELIMMSKNRTQKKQVAVKIKVALTQ